MSFLEELENNKKKKEQVTEKTPRQLWESCFKYFKHFTSIIQGDESTFESEFNFTFLNLKREVLIIGPYEVSRTHDETDLKLELKMFTQLKKGIRINRKDSRSAEILQTRLFKDNIVSTIKKDKENNVYIEINSTIPSSFRILLKNNEHFYIEYKNISSSTSRSIRLAADKINESSMDEIAKYIIGQNPNLYTESISNQEITKIREKIKLDKQIKAKREALRQAEIEEQEKLDAIKKANTLKEKSKRFFINKSDELKNKVLEKLKNLKK
jgi:hypothetical protein